MEAFQLYYEEFNCRVWPSPLTKKEPSKSEHKDSANHPLLSPRKRKAAVQLQHRLKETYSVLTAPDGSSGVTVDTKEKVLGSQLIHLEYGAAAAKVNGVAIVTALSALGVETDVWEAVADPIRSLKKRHDHDEMLITVDFLTHKMYRCFEEVTDSW